MKKQFVFCMAAVLIWSTNATLAKFLMRTMPGFETIGLSALFAFLAMLVINAFTGKLKELKRYTRRQMAQMVALGVIGPFLNAAFYYNGLRRLTAQEACIVNYLWPIMLVLFSMLLLREKMTAAKAVAMLCSFAGIVVLCSGGEMSTGGSRFTGVVSCVLGAMTYGLFSVLNKKLDYDQNVTMMVMWPAVAVCALTASFATETWVPIRGLEWLGILWMGLISSALAYLLWSLALNGAESTAFLANLAYLTPFLSVVLSAVALREGLQLRALFALILIVGGIVLQSVWSERTAEKETQT